MEIGYCLDCNELNYAMTNAYGDLVDKLGKYEDLEEMKKKSPTC